MSRFFSWTKEAGEAEGDAFSDEAVRRRAYRSVRQAPVLVEQPSSSTEEEGDSSLLSYADDGEESPRAAVNEQGDEPMSEDAFRRAYNQDHDQEPDPYQDQSGSLTYDHDDYSALDLTTQNSEFAHDSVERHQGRTASDDGPSSVAYRSHTRASRESVERTGLYLRDHADLRTPAFSGQAMGPRHDVIRGPRDGSFTQQRFKTEVYRKLDPVAPAEQSSPSARERDCSVVRLIPEKASPVFRTDTGAGEGSLDEGRQRGEDKDLKKEAAQPVALLSTRVETLRAETGPSFPQVAGAAPNRGGGVQKTALETDETLHFASVSDDRPTPAAGAERSFSLLPGADVETEPSHAQLTAEPSASNSGEVRRETAPYDPPKSSGTADAGKLLGAQTGSLRPSVLTAPENFVAGGSGHKTRRKLPTWVYRSSLVLVLAVIVLGATWAALYGALPRVSGGGQSIVPGSTSNTRGDPQLAVEPADPQLRIEQPTRTIDRTPPSEAPKSETAELSRTGEATSKAEQATTQESGSQSLPGPAASAPTSSTDAAVREDHSVPALVLTPMLGIPGSNPSRVPIFGTPQLSLPVSRATERALPSEPLNQTALPNAASEPEPSQQDMKAALPAGAPADAPAEARSGDTDAPVPTTGRKTRRSAKLEAANGQAERLLASGQILAARLLFQDAAAKGDPRGARGIARTYDERVIGRFSASGVMPDREQAELWYRVGNRLEARQLTRKLGKPDEKR